MTNVAKDEAELIEQVALAILDYGVINNTISTLATSALAAIRAAGWAVVPVEPTEEMRRATWEAQFRHTNEKLHIKSSDWKIRQLVQARMDDPKQREMDFVAYAATLAAAPGVKP